MDRNSILNPENTKSVCEEVKSILQDDNEGLTDLFKAVSGFSNDSVLQGSMYDSLKKHVADYNLVIDAIKMANELICLKSNQLTGSVGSDYLDGNIIIGKIEEYDRCISNAYQNAAYWRQDKARFESEHPFSLLDPVSWNNPYSGPNPYEQDAEDYKKLREIWNSKAIRYDNINKSTTNLFSQANILIYNARWFLNIINSRTVDGINVVFERDNSARNYLKNAYESASEILEAEKNQEIKDNYYKYTLGGIEDFWLIDDTFDDPYWYQDQTKRALAIEYMRQEIQLTGPYPLLKGGQLSEEEIIIRERKTVLINYLANAPHGAAFDYLLPALENSCSCFGVDLYDGIGYTDEDSFIVTEELLDLLIKNEERRIGKEFGYWCDRGGGDILDGALTLGYGVVYTAGTPKGDTISYDEQLEIDVTMGNQTTASIRQLNTHDVAADALAERIGGMPRAAFQGENREFDVISEEYIAQAKPALSCLNPKVRSQMKATFEAALAHDKIVYYQFEGMPNQCVIDKLYEYSARYGVEVIIDTNPLGVTNN